MVETTNWDKGMEYRYLGRSGLRVSVFSFGNWVNSNDEKDYENTRDCMKKCFELGVNFFDTAEVYGQGQAEIAMGRAIKELGFRREDIVVSTKFMNSGPGPNDRFMSRKHLMEGINDSLKRLQLDYVDVAFSHRPDYETPLEETCRAFHQMIEDGKTFYWGTSDWPADRIIQAIEICERYNLHKPITEQPMYHMLGRDKFEKEYRRVFSEYGYGTTIWSPLAGGLLTGKYNDGNIPEGSRYDKQKGLVGIYNKYFGDQKKEETCKKLQALGEYAKSLGYTQAQLSLAWTIANKDVSTCIQGYSRVSQVEENAKALELYKKWTPEIEAKVREILNNDPEKDTNFRHWKDMPMRRDVAMKK